MILKNKYLLPIFLFTTLLFSQKRKEYKVHTIAFYNLENLFDPEDDPLTFDDDRTPKGKDRWTYDLYAHKIKNMARVIAKIGTDVSNNAPAIIGVAEIENRKVLENLTIDSSLVSNRYDIVHFDSPDRRGIDVALLYQKAFFKVKKAQKYELIIYDKTTNKRLYTRDQLLVSGYLDGDLIHVIVNHWPSRRGGETRSQYKREKAAALNKKIMDSLFTDDPYAKIITMGDLNDTPNSPSIKKILATKKHIKDVEIKGLYNPMEQLAKKGIGSLAWRDQWSLFDQIIISKEFLTSDYSSYQYYKAGIYNPSYLITATGRYKGYPYRSYTNGSYSYGYSDHFAVYIYLIKEKK
ncbi:endonuclease [Aquimarina aquimarini]|uniref:endonuclease/exonuclease/phosphatase family protein n=1 Tax=Aquimarina aquimarini TaxID=1191734 RepID=UPI000D55F2FA|nr:endonuclease [Aquimarina aquimarini]